MLAISDKYALPLLLAVLALIKEIIKTSKVLKILIPKTINPKKFASKID